MSLPKGVDPLSVELDEAIIYIKEKEKADAPIYMYQGFSRSQKEKEGLDHLLNGTICLSMSIKNMIGIIYLKQIL